MTSSDQGLSFPEERAWVRGWHRKTLCGKDDIFHKIFCVHLVTSTFVSSIGRAWDCSEKVCFDIPRSPVQSRHGGFHLFDFLVKCLSFTTHSFRKQDADVKRTRDVVLWRSFRAIFFGDVVFDVFRTRD